MIYSREVINGFKLLEKAPSISDKNEFFFEAESEDRSLGVWVKCQMLIEKEIIKEVNFFIFGCPDTLVSANKIKSIIQNQAIHDVKCIDMLGIRKNLNIPVEKMGKILVIENAFQECLKVFFLKR